MGRPPFELGSRIKDARQMEIAETQLARKLALLDVRMCKLEVFVADLKARWPECRDEHMRKLNERRR